MRGAYVLYSDYEALADELEQERVKLAVCLVAADGHKADCKEGDYEWSPAFQRVLELRARVEDLERPAKRMRREATRSSSPSIRSAP